MTYPYAADLHTHSPLVRQDYRGPESTTPEDVVEAAVAAGLDVLILSDHFSLGFFRGLQAAADALEERAGRRLLVLPGAELKVTYEGDETHLVAVFPPEDAERRLASLCVWLGLDGELDRPDNLHLVKVEHDPVGVADRIRELGGLCHLAHVDRSFEGYRFMDSALFDRVLRDAPIAAIELVDPASLAVLGDRTRGVPCVQSSDAHSPAEIGRRQTVLHLDEHSFDGVYRALSECGAGAAPGVGFPA